MSIYYFKIKKLNFKILSWVNQKREIRTSIRTINTKFNLKCKLSPFILWGTFKSSLFKRTNLESNNFPIF